MLIERSMTAPITSAVPPRSPCSSLKSIPHRAAYAGRSGRTRGPPGGNAVVPSLSFTMNGFIMRSPIAYFGGKAKFAKFLLPLFPDHARYVEVFGGGGGLLFAKSMITCDLEVYNDIDSALFEFFTVLANPRQFGQFKRLVEAQPFSRQLHVHCFKTWHREKKIVPRVAKWYIAMRQGFSGRLSGSWGYSVSNGRDGKSQGVSKWLGGIKRLPEIHARLQGVQIDHRDFRAVIEAYDKPDTFFYCDPPYVPDTRRSGSYRHEMTEDDHRDLVELLLKIEGKALLSGYATELYRPLEVAGWERREFAVTCSAAARTKGSGLQGPGAVKQKQKRTEVVWANYPLPE